MPTSEETEAMGERPKRAIDFDCPDCGAPVGERCVEKRPMSGFARRELKTLHRGRYFEASMSRPLKAVRP